MILKNSKMLERVSEDAKQSDFMFYRGQLKQEVVKLNGKLQGLSAVQLGTPVKAFTMRDPKTMDFSFVFNPTVLRKIGFRISFEGCLSERERYLVIRPIFIKAKWVDETGKEITKWLSPKKTRIFMHEVDHLNGITIAKKGLMVARACYVSKV
jgi:peptide deformylase